jgi:hypothetical protein
MPEGKRQANNKGTGFRHIENRELFAAFTANRLSVETVTTKFYESRFEDFEQEIHAHEVFALLLRSVVEWVNVDSVTGCCNSVHQRGDDAGGVVHDERVRKNQSNDPISTGHIPCLTGD